MNFIVSSSILLKHLSHLVGVIPSNPVLPILENFLFDIRNGHLNITSSDLQTSIMTWLNVESNQQGQIAIPAKMLMDTLKNLPEQPITFKVDLDTYSTELVTEKGRYKISCENATDFPKLPDLKRTNKFELSTGLLESAISSTLFAAGTDELKPAMMGLFFNFTSDYFDFVSTDTKRLVRYRRRDFTTDSESSFIVHKKALSILKSSLPSENQPLDLEFNETNASFKFANIKMVCRLVDEKFPDYELVVPKNNSNLVYVDRDEIMSSLKRLTIYANKTTAQVRFNIIGNSMKVSAEDLDFFNEASETLSCDHEGEDIEIAFGGKLLLELINAVSTPRVLIKLSESNRPCIIEPSDNGEKEELTSILMPLMLMSYATA
jgi:DNA polymerase-3 subunit beta